MKVHPIYELNEDFKYNLTIDGRIGKIFEFQDYFSAIENFLKIFKKYQFLHLQYQNYFNKHILSVSFFIDGPKPKIYQNLLYTTDDTRKNIIESCVLLDQIEKEFNLKSIYYPDIKKAINKYNQYHIFKLKKLLSDSELLEEKYHKKSGLCLIKTPYLKNYTKNLYFTESNLKEMILSELLCIEYVAHFKEKAFYLWLPMAANFYLIELFKL